MSRFLSPSVRPTDAVSALVDRGIALPQILGRDLVAAFLLRRGVRITVIVRVLHDPIHRRNAERESIDAFGA